LTCRGIAVRGAVFSCIPSFRENPGPVNSGDMCLRTGDPWEMMDMSSSAEIHITSGSNRRFKEFRSLLSARGVKRHGKALVAGGKLVRELISRKPEMVLSWIAPQDGESPPPELPDGVPRFRLAKALFREIDVNGTGSPILLAGIPAMEPFRREDLAEDITLFVPFQDPVNVGAVIRSAAAFGVTTVVLLKEAAHPFLPKSLRAGGTPLFFMRYMLGPSVAEVRAEDVPVVALSPAGKSIHDFSFPGRFVLLPGMEGTGLPGRIRPSHTVSIPMERGVESLNAAVAVSIALYEWRRTGKWREERSFRE